MPPDPEDVLTGSVPLDLSHAGGDLLALLHNELDEEGPAHQCVTSTYVCGTLTQLQQKIQRMAYTTQSRTKPN